MYPSISPHFYGGTLFPSFQRRNSVLKIRSSGKFKHLSPNKSERLGTQCSWQAQSCFHRSHFLTNGNSNIIPQRRPVLAAVTGTNEKADLNYMGPVPNFPIMDPLCLLSPELARAKAKCEKGYRDYRPVRNL
jgi:hypothetical protein